MTVKLKQNDNTSSPFYGLSTQIKRAQNSTSNVCEHAITLMAKWKEGIKKSNW